MKTLIAVFLALVLIPFASITAGVLAKEKKSAAVDNLTVGITSDNSGLRTSSANVLTNLITDAYLEDSDARKAMIPLLEMLEKGKTDCERRWIISASYNWKS